VFFITHTVDERVYQYRVRLENAPIGELLILKIAIEEELERRGY
jgi:hypothetical protein